MEFVLIGTFKQARASIVEKIKKLGGKVGTEIHDRVTAIISTKKKVRKMGKRLRKARKHNIQVVSEEFLDEIQKPDADPILYINSKSISDWTGNVSSFRERNQHLNIWNTTLKTDTYF